MKNFRKVIALLLVAVMVLSTFAIAASADANGKYVTVSISTDKTGYGALDTADVTVTVKNETDSALSNVVVCAKANDWRLRINGGSNKLAIGTLGAHASKSYSFRGVLSPAAKGVKWYNKVLIFLKSLFFWVKGFVSYDNTAQNSAETSKTIDHGGAVITITAKVFYDKPANPYYTVSFNANGHGTAPKAQSVKCGEKAKEPSPKPTEEGYNFLGWYKEAKCTNKWNFSDKVTADITLYAKWELHSHNYDKTKWKYDGTNHWHECSCGAKTDVTPHSWQITNETTNNGKRTVYYACTESGCGAERTLVFQGDYLVFGEYPQSELKDSGSIAILNKEANLSTTKWTRFNYYFGDADKDDGKMASRYYMQYVDINYDGAKYRGVKFSAYRPATIGGTSGKSEQEKNGYEPGTIYWFKFEPLLWKVLDETTGVVMCKSIIDAQPYTCFVENYATDHEYHNETGAYASDWTTSYIRKWLNEDFAKTAFTDDEIKNVMGAKANVNKSWGTMNGHPENKKYDSCDTADKVSLLSWDELIDSQYGFTNTYDVFDANRMAKGTDYAKMEGLYVYDNAGSEYKGFSWWWLRTPGFDSNSACIIYNVGEPQYTDYVNFTNRGVRPVLCFPMINAETAP